MQVPHPPDDCAGYEVSGFCSPDLNGLYRLRTDMQHTVNGKRTFWNRQHSRFMYQTDAEGVCLFAIAAAGSQEERLLTCSDSRAFQMVQPTGFRAITRDWMELVSGSSFKSGGSCKIVSPNLRGLQRLELTKRLRLQTLKVFKHHVLKVRWKRGVDRKNKQQQLKDVIKLLEARAPAWQSKLSKLLGVSECEVQGLFMSESGCPHSCITVGTVKRILTSAVRILNGSMLRIIVTTLAGEEICSLQAAEKWSVSALLDMISTRTSVPLSPDCSTLLAGAAELLPADQLKDIPGAVGGSVMVSLLRFDARARVREEKRAGFIQKLRAILEKRDDQFYRAQMLWAMKRAEWKGDTFTILSMYFGLEEVDAKFLFNEYMDVAKADFLDETGLAHFTAMDGSCS